MRPDQERHQMLKLRVCRDALEEALERLGGELYRPPARDIREPPVDYPGPEVGSDGEILDSTIATLRRVESDIYDIANFLLEDLSTRERRESRISRTRRRLRRWMSFRLGTLRQHPPEPLKLPARYFAVDPPDPAPTISIVTPSFQQGQFLERTIYSVVNQNYPALEYVVQDGGSSDQSVEILRRFEPWLTGWRSEPDGGQADAINRGFAATSGEIMAYLNSDDMLLPGSLAYVARYFAAHPDVDVVYGHRMLVNEHDAKIGIWVMPKHDDRALTLIDFVPQETLFWRRRVWAAAGGKIDTDLHFAIDWDLLLRLRDAGAKMVRLPRYLGAFRVHDEQKTALHDDLALTESTRLRERVHGRVVSHDEAYGRVHSYLRRHVLHHNLHRLRARLPQRRVHIRALPLEPWFRADGPNGKPASIAVLDRASSVQATDR